jgi:integrase
VLKDVAFSEYAFTLPKCRQRLPDLLSRGEVHRLIQVSKTPIHRLLLLSCYACGLRVSERVRIRIADIDGERHLLHVVQGKGHKDRYVPIPDALLQEWRKHWRYTRTERWLFPSHKDQHLSITTPQKLYRSNKRSLGIQKHGGFQLQCQTCDASQLLYHACRNRHCPRCQQQATDA